MKDIFDDESNEIITKVFDFVKDNYGRKSFFQDRHNWDTLLGIPKYLIDNHNIFTFADNVNEENNFKVVRTNTRNFILENGVINNFNIGTTNDWYFKKSINNIFTEFYINHKGTMPHLINIINYIYEDCNIKLNDYKTINNIPEDDIYIYFKGGLLYNLLSKSMGVSFDGIKKSDFDLDIYINPSIANYELHFFNVNKIIFNVLDTFNTNPLEVFPEEISKSIKILLNKVYKPDDLTELYNKLNEHIKDYDKSELSDEFKNIQEITQLQFSNFVYYTMDGTNEKANIYKYNKDVDKLDKIRGFDYENKPKMDIEINEQLRALLERYPYKDEEKTLTNIIFQYSYRDYKLFLQEPKNIITYTDENLQHIFTGSFQDDEMSKFKLTYNSAHYYNKSINDDDITSFNLFRLLMPNYLLLSYNNEGVKSYKMKSFFNEILDISIVKKNDFSFKYVSKNDVTDYKLIKGKDPSGNNIFNFKGKNIEGLLKDLAYQFNDKNYNKKEKRAKRFSEILILYIDTFKMNSISKGKLYNNIYKILIDGKLPKSINNTILDFIMDKFEKLYSNYRENEEIINAIKDNKINYVFRSGSVDETAYYDNLTYRKYMKYKIKYLNLLKKLKK